MRLFVFSNIHGDLSALDKMLWEIEQLKPDLVFCGGNLVGFGSHPNEVIERIRNQRIPTLMGEWDRAVGYDLAVEVLREMHVAQDQAALKEAQKVVKEHNKLYLRGLLDQTVLQIYGKTIWIIHQYPKKLGLPKRKLGWMGFSSDENWDMLICGKSNVADIQTFGDRMVVDPGSVGVTQDQAAPEFLEVVVGPNCLKPIWHRLDREKKEDFESSPVSAWSKPINPLSVNTYEAIEGEYRY